MPEIKIPYDKDYLIVTVPESTLHITPIDIPAADEPLERVQSAIANPLGDKRLDDYRHLKTVAIAINDKTRPVPHQHLLPPLLQALEDIGIAAENITLMIATGSHLVMPPEEYSWILSQDIIERYRIICHDSTDTDNMVYLGDTERGTPFYVNKQYLAADLRIVVGNIEPHQFMGFSGGVKSAVIGLTDKRTINANHSMMTEEFARLGEYERNPMRQDVEEMGRMLGVHFALNSLLNGEKKIVDVLFGDPVAVMQASIPRVRERFQIAIPEPLDVLILSAGGFPKDINIYQGQKALGHATPIMKRGGTIIWCAACAEGTGSQGYEDWILQEYIQSHEDVITHFKSEGFRIGPHKAFQLARDGVQVNILMKTEIDADFVRQLLFEPVDDVQMTLDKLLGNLPNTAKIGFIPHGNVTIPIVVES